MSETIPNETENTDGQGVNRLAWFLVGVVVGAAAALLYAPQSGKKTRDYLAEKGQAGCEKLEGAGRDIVDGSRDLYDKGRELVDDAADLFERGRKLVRG